MNKKKIYPVLALLLALVAACKKESTRVEYANTPEFVFPQGNAPHDAELVSWQQKYGTYFIYRFTNDDFNRFTKEMQWGTRMPEFAIQGDERRMGPFVTLLKEEWLRFYPDTLMKSLLPYKVFLAASVTDTAKKTAFPFSARYKSFAITGASAQMDTLSSAGRKQFRITLNLNFMGWWLVTMGKMEVPAAFYAQSNYALTLTEANRAGEGFLRAYTTKDATRRLDDLMEFFVLAFTHSPEWLAANLFTPQADPKGKLKAKYNILADHFKARYNIDLRAMGS